MEHNHLQSRLLTLRHNSQQLLLGLKPIKLISNTYLLFEIIELTRSDCSSQFHNQIASLPISNAAKNSVSQIKLANEYCMEPFQHIAPHFKIKI